MFPRNSTKKHDTDYEGIKHYEKIFKYDLLKTFEQVEANYLAAKNSTPQEQITALRSLLKVTQYYSAVKTAFAENKLLGFELKRIDFIYKALSLNKAINLNILTSGQVYADLAHVEKIMARYILDFDKAFDFWVMSNLMREKFQYRGNTGKRLFDVAVKIAIGDLIELGKKGFLSEQQVRDIYPALTIKMAVSEAKRLVAYHKANKNTSTLEFSDDLLRLDQTTQSKLRK